MAGSPRNPYHPPLGKGTDYVGWVEEQNVEAGGEGAWAALEVCVLERSHSHQCLCYMELVGELCSSPDSAYRKDHHNGKKEKDEWKERTEMT